MILKQYFVEWGEVMFLCLPVHKFAFPISRSIVKEEGLGWVRECHLFSVSLGFVLNYEIHFRSVNKMFMC